MKNEEIGICWFNEEVTDGNASGEIWWGICKKTKKVAFAIPSTNSINAFAPMVMQTTSIEDNECFDNEGCLNINCPYSSCNNLADVLSKKSIWKEVNDSEKVIHYFEEMFDFVSNYIDEMDEDERQEVFVDDYDTGTVFPDAFITKLKEGA